MDFNKAALEMHETHKGKVGIVSKVEVATRDDLSTAYTPGVAEPCRKIKENPEDVYKYTFKGNMVAVVSNGTAVLGLGDIYAKSKVEVGLASLKENGFDPARAVMIGDSVHDYEVAQALGVRCVLQSGGHQPPEKLRETGAPVVKGLREAAALILE